MKGLFLIQILFLAWIAASVYGCAGTSPQVRKLTKPIDTTAEELVKIRKVKSEGGQTRAVVSPADERQLRIPF